MSKSILLSIFITLSFSATSQNTVGGKTVSVPEAEVDRQSKFLDAERERMLGRFDKALPVYKEFLLENPANDAAWYGLARCHAGLKDDSQAFDAIRKAMESDPANHWYSVFYADLLERNGRIPEAFKVHEKLTKQFPATPEFFQKAAYLAVLAGDPKSGLKMLDQLEKLTGVTEETALKKHLIFAALGDSKKAAAELQKLADNYPEEPKYRHDLAQYLLQTGDQSAARKVFEQILKANPDDAQAKMALMEKTKASGDAAFLENLKPVFQDPNAPIDAKIKQVVPYLAKLELGSDPDLTQKLLELGKSLETAHPDDAKAWSLSGDLFYLSNRPTEALEKYRQCIKLNATVFSVWENTLDILNGEKNYAEMFKVAEKALDAFPNQARAYYYYGVAALETGQIDDAIVQLEQANLMSANNIGLRLDIADLLGQAFLKKRDFAEAKTRLEAVLTKGGEKHPGVLERLGDAYFQLGEPAKAREFWQKANSIRRSPILEQKISSGKM